jgi:MoxR-like ATPase
MTATLDRALEAWHTAAASLNFEATQQRHQTIQAAAAKLRQDPPAFDATDLESLLAQLSSARRMRRQIIEANDTDVLILTLRAFLFDEEPLTQKFATYPSLIRYAGLPILGELYGLVHADHAPIYTRQALTLLRALGWQVPPSNYSAFAAAYATLRAAYDAALTPVVPGLPRLIEIHEFLHWLATQPTLLADSPPKEQRTAVPAPLPPPTAPQPTLQPRPVPPATTSAIREFGAGYEVAPPTRTWPDSPLARPTPERLAVAETAIRRTLALPADVIRRAAAHLLAGRHLILTGAPGTGKSHLAHLLTTTLFGYTPMLVTATAEWSAFDVIGGLVPTTDANGSLRYTIRPGYVYSAVAQNWLLAPDGTPQRAANQPLRRLPPAAAPESAGLWLIIDELNRADVDKAFGELFTALESGWLRVPRQGQEGSQLLPIPQDFRIIATLNTRDRHFLFTLSDALKRRFAFVELLPPDDPQTEREILLQRATAALAAQELPIEPVSLAGALDQLQPFALVARALAPANPLGTAPLLAALRYVGAANALGLPVSASQDFSNLVEEAVLAEVAPQLEGLRELPLHLLTLLAAGQPEALIPRLEQEIGSVGLLDSATARTIMSLANALQQLAALANDSSVDNAVANLTRTLAVPSRLEQETTLYTSLHALRTPAARHFPHLNWPRVAALFAGWLAERQL